MAYPGPSRALLPRFDEREKSAPVEDSAKQPQQHQQQQQQQQQTAAEAKEKAKAEATAKKLAEDERRRRIEEAVTRARRVEEARKDDSPTTLSTYLEANHEFLYPYYVHEAKKCLKPQRGEAPYDPAKKLCPARLMPWLDFSRQQNSMFDLLESSFPSDKAQLHSRSRLLEAGELVAEEKILDKHDLKRALRETLEEPVRRIINIVGREPTVRERFNLGNGIHFEGGPNASLSDVALEVVSRRDAGERQRQYLISEQFYVYNQGSEAGEARKPAYMIDQRGPHELPPSYLHHGLRPMDVHRVLANRATPPLAGDPKSVFRYHAELLAAVAVTKTFHYMIEGGLEYALLTSGEVLIFLKIDWADPAVLYYHMAEPNYDVLVGPGNPRRHTAVGQLLGFSLLTFGLQGRQIRVSGQDQRRSAMKHLKTCSMDLDAVLRYIPPDLASLHPYTLPTYPGPRNWPPTPPPRKTPSRNMNKRKRVDEIASLNVGGAGAGAGGGRRYCTQKCLLGLLSGAGLDETCPNVGFHRCHAGDHRYHPLTHPQWLQSLCQQLSKSLDEGVVCLGTHGARGVMFQVTLLEYGYTFVGKGTVAEFATDLEHEADVYSRLWRLQGITIPVNLGRVDLRGMSRVHYCDLRVRIVYMMFLSWGGYSLREDGPRMKLDECLGTAGTSLQTEAVLSLQSMHRSGVLHCDTHPRNSLWNTERGRLMLIDFDRAVPVEPETQNDWWDSEVPKEKDMKEPYKGDMLRAQWEFRPVHVH